MQKKYIHCLGLYNIKQTAMKNISPLKKQLIKFTLIGILAVIVDLIFYYILLNALPEKLFSTLSNEAFSKGLSFICGMTVTYVLNKFWTWKKNNRSRKRIAKFSFLYGLSLLINVGVNTVLLFTLYEFKLLIDLPNKYLIAFIGATGVSACVNFIGQKFWVFNSKI